MKYEKLQLNDEKKIAKMSQMAKEIWREHYASILEKDHLEYLIETFQSESAIREQLEHGYQYYFVIDKIGKTVGFMAFYPKDQFTMYISKLYLYKSERGKGYGKKMFNFVWGKAKLARLCAIELNVNKENPTIAIYEKLGLTRIRAEVNDVGNGYVMDDYVYGMQI